jgi:hypothetical protein
MNIKNTAIDIQTTDNEHKKYIGLFQRMESIKFMKGLELMHDVLEDLTNLSLQLQERFCTITRVDKLIKRAICVVRTLKKKQKPPKHQCA